VDGRRVDVKSQIVFFCVVAVLMQLLTGAVYCEPLSVHVNASAAILINADTGKVLFEKDPYSPYFPASITKVATALYAFDKLKDRSLDELVAADQDSIGAISSEEKKRSGYTKPAYWLEFGSTHIGIKRGEKLPLVALYYAVLLASANDASNVVAKHVSGSIPDFMNELNAYLADLGCRDTVFYNPHGLHHPEHHTTAYDMALIAREAMKNPMFRKIVSTVRYERPQTNMQEPSWMVNSNLLIRKGKSYYPYAIGIKRGYHKDGNHTLIAGAEKDGRTLIAVILNCKSGGEVFQTARDMFETAFNQQKSNRLLLKKGEQSICFTPHGGNRPLRTLVKKDVMLEYYPAEEPNISAEVHWQQLELPISQGQYVGDINIVADDSKIIEIVPLFAANDVKKTFMTSIKEMIDRLF